MIRLPQVCNQFQLQLLTYFQVINYNYNYLSLVIDYVINYYYNPLQYNIGQKYSKDSRIEFACFSFHVGFLFLSTFCLSNRTPKITRILTLYQANVPTLTSTVFLIKHTPKLIIFGIHNLPTFRHNTLINKVLLMQFYLFNIHPKLHHLKLRQLCITLFRTFSTYTSSRLMLLFVQPLSGNSLINCQAL